MIDLDKLATAVADEAEEAAPPSYRVEDDPWFPAVQDAADIVGEALPPTVEIVEGVIAEQSKLLIGSGSKSFKTWLTMDMALSIAHGVPFLERATTRRRVLYVNLELKPATFKRRLQDIAKGKEITVERDWFRHLPLRGRMAGMTVDGLVTRIIRLAQHFQAGVVVADPVYKMNVEGEENSSLDQTLFFNQMDRITTEGRCTLILNDHFSKGNQSEKDPLDAIRGSSAKGGDIDAAMVLRKHEVDNCYRVDLVHRELPPVEPFCIGWEFPLMRLREDLSPEAMRKAKPGRRKGHDPIELLAAILDTTARHPISISAWAKCVGIPRVTLLEYLPDLHRQGLITTVGEGLSARQHITDKGRNLARQAPEEAQ